MLTGLVGRESRTLRLASSMLIECRLIICLLLCLWLCSLVTCSWTVLGTTGKECRIEVLFEVVMIDLLLGGSREIMDGPEEVGIPVAVITLWQVRGANGIIIGRIHREV